MQVLTKEEKIAKINEINLSDVLNPQQKIDSMEKFLDEQDALDVLMAEEKKAQDKAKENESLIQQKADEEKARAEVQAKSDASIKKVEIINEPTDLAGKIFSLLKGEKGEPGKDAHMQGPPGKTPTKKELVKIIKPLISEMKPKEVDMTIIAIEAAKITEERLKPFIPTTETIKKEMPVMAEKIRDSLETLEGEEKLDGSAIKDFTKITVSRTPPPDPEFGELWLDLSA